MKQNKYTLENKPSFKDGDFVLVDMGCYGFPDGTNRNGYIVGRASEHIIDMWLVQFDEYPTEYYKFKVLSVPHTFIFCKESR